ECEGRGVETRGLNKAADYIAAAFKQAGLKPAGPDGSYFQPFSIAGQPRQGGQQSLAFRGPGGKSADPGLNEKYTVCRPASSGAASGGVVFAGYGVTTDDGKYDDYAGIDAAGKVVIVLRKVPHAGDKEKSPLGPDFENKYSPLTVKLDNAHQHKA